MKVFALATIVAMLGAGAVAHPNGHAGKTVRALRDSVSERCASACDPLINEVGNCLQNLNTTLSVCVNTSDLMDFGTKGDYLGVRDCLCSEAAFQASESCLACASEQLGLKSAPLTVADHRAMCADAIGTLASLEQRYQVRPSPGGAMHVICPSCSAHDECDCAANGGAEEEAPAADGAEDEAPAEDVPAEEEPIDDAEEPTEDEGDVNGEEPGEDGQVTEDLNGNGA